MGRQVRAAAGPGAVGRRPVTPLYLFLPLVALCLALVVACIGGAALIAPRAALAWAMHAVPLAACATLASLALAIAPAAQGGGFFWLAPLCLSPVLGGLSWALLPAPHSAGSVVARASLLTMPLMACLLEAAWSWLPDGVLRAAAAAGAPPSTQVWLFLRMRLPGVARACLLVGIVCLALIGPEAP